MSARGAAVGAAITAIAAIAPARHPAASISGIQNLALNRAGIVIATFTGVMVALTKGSFANALPTGQDAHHELGTARAPV